MGECLTCDLPVPVAPTIAISGRLGLCKCDDIRFSAVFHMHSGAHSYSLGRFRCLEFATRKCKALGREGPASRRYPPEPPPLSARILASTGAIRLIITEDFIAGASKFWSFDHLRRLAKDLWDVEGAVVSRSEG